MLSGDATVALFIVPMSLSKLREQSEQSLHFYEFGMNGGNHIDGWATDRIIFVYCLCFTLTSNFPGMHDLNCNRIVVVAGDVSDGCTTLVQ